MLPTKHQLQQLLKDNVQAVTRHLLFQQLTPPVEWQLNTVKWVYVQFAVVEFQRAQ